MAKKTDKKEEKKEEKTNIQKKNEFLNVDRNKVPRSPDYHKEPPKKKDKI